MCFLEDGAVEDAPQDLSVNKEVLLPIETEEDSKMSLGEDSQG